jgi:TonB family protein
MCIGFGLYRVRQSVVEGSRGMKHPFIMGLAVILLLSGVAAGQDAGTADPRLSDPAFIKIRDEALAAAKCADRTNPVGVSTPKVRYPDALSRDRISGIAITEGIILPAGSLAYIRVLRTDHPEFGKAALEVLKQYRYKPGTCGGQPVPRFVTITHTFAVK